MEYELSLDFLDFIEGLKKFKVRRKIRPSEKAILAFDGQFCSIEALNIVIVTKATGIWPGIARFSASVIAALAKFPPTSDPVIARITDNQLRLGNLNVGCEWQPASQILMDLPAAPDWIEALSLKYRASRAQILSSALDKQITLAEHKLERLIARVARSLAPLGVTNDDIRTLVESRLAARYVKRA